jgi:hypothetical protein
MIKLIDYFIKLMYDKMSHFAALIEMTFYANVRWNAKFSLH